MKRRAFIAALGGAAAWPAAVWGQQPSKVWCAGYLASGMLTKGNITYFDAFRTKLQDLGYVEGSNLKLDVRRANDDYSRLPALAADLVSLAPEVIAAAGSPATAALQRETSSIPIVMTGFSIRSERVCYIPCKTRWQHHGLSLQGVDLTAKTVELLHLVVEKAKRIAVLMSTNAVHEALLKEAHAGAEQLGLTLILVMARTPNVLDGAFGTMHNENCDALLVLADTRITQKIVELTDKWRLPAIYQLSGFVEMGGLLSYSAGLPELFRQSAVFVDKLLKGANPAELPVQQPTKFELVINLKTAKALGLTVSPSLLARADEVIE
jgi:putative ABC transport system substrate-binding protein